MRHSAPAVIVLLMSIATGSKRELFAEPLWRQILSGSRVEADASVDYVLGQEHGPWLVLAATFSGDGAEQQSRELVLELRRRFHLPAYVHEMSFDLSLEAPSAGVDRRGRPKRMRYQRGGEVREIAVLVGDFPSVQDLEAQRVLKRVWQIKPQALSVEQRQTTSQNLAGWRQLKNRLLAKHGARGRRGPMGHAFLTRNSLLPKEYFVPKGVDKFVERMNYGVKYSLLKCRGKYTVQVATFRAPVVISGMGRSLATSGRKDDKNRGDALHRAAQNAHHMTLALRKLKWEAYEFHERDQSIVTVGSFEKATTSLPDGREVVVRDVQITLRTFDAAYPLPVTDHKAARQIQAAKDRLTTKFAQQIGNQPIGLHPKQIANIPFDIHPRVIDAPKRSVSSRFAWN